MIRSVDRLHTIVIKLKLFITGFIQVVLICVNTWQIANKKYLGVSIVGFFIAFIWSMNVKSIAFGSKWDRVIYALGASIGSITGVKLAEYWYM